MLPCTGEYEQMVAQGRKAGRKPQAIRARVALEAWLFERSPRNRAALVTAHAYLCARASRKFLRPGLERCDLEQVATIGLLKASDRYDAAQQTPFEAYAWLFIVGELMHHVRDCERLIRPPRKVRSLERRARRAGEELVLSLGRKPTRPELAQHLGISESDLAGIDQCRARAVAESLDCIPASRHRRAPGEQEIDATVDRLLIDRALGMLSAAERTILWGVYTGGYTQSEIAGRLGYSQRHVSRMHRAALQKIAPLCAENYAGNGH